MLIRLAMDAGKNFFVVLLALLTIVTLTPSLVFAASLTGLSDTMSSSKVSTASSHVIRFTTPTGATDSSDTIIITFPADFNFTSKTIGTLTFTHGATTGLESTETLAASPSASAWGAVFSGTQNRILTLTAPSDGVGAAALSATHKVIITYDSTNSINPSSPATYELTINGTFGDTGSVTVSILSDDVVAVSATVPQSLTFTISDNTIGFGTLSVSTSTFATGDTNGSTTANTAHTLVAGTNGGSGYTVTVTGATLTYSSFSITAIGSNNTAPASGTEQFGLRLTASGGSGTVTAPYAASGYAYNATSTAVEVAAASGATSNTTFSAFYLASIASNTEAGGYTTNLTYTATARF